MKNPTKLKSSYGIHWFRRDLRVEDNRALLHNIRVNQGHVLGLFCFDSNFLKRNDFSFNRFAFFLQTLRSLKDEFKKNGGDLLVLDAHPERAFSTIFTAFQQVSQPLPSLVSWNRDYEPFARQRDDHIQSYLSDQWGINIHTARDHLVLEPNEVLKKDAKSPYQVYTPFAKRWFEIFHSKPPSELLVKNLELNSEFSWKSILGTQLQHFEDKLESFIKKNSKHVYIEIPKAGSIAAKERLLSFKKQLENYSNNRDIPAIDATSKISIYIKNGSITTDQIVKNLKLQSGQDKFFKELVWREFYYSILYHFPRVEKEPFIEKYKDLDWENDLSLFDAWCEGNTGFPIVDAGMRQLKNTGWMHNRVRMIVASFLTKDLLIDWRYGENYFMKTLLDGDLACNNGGWQWAASTGCDPQPYFRIFNPLLQSLKFDPKGNYIRTYVKELANLPENEIHNPPEKTRKLLKYPLPIVDHNIRKIKALALYRRVVKKGV